MAYTTIDDPSEYFHTQLYTGNGSSQSITNDANAGDFQPDWIWGTLRNEDGGARWIFDSTRGTTKRLKTNDSFFLGHQAGNYEQLENCESDKKAYKSFKHAVRNEVK
jgi:hypothetical protein